MTIEIIKTEFSYNIPEQKEQQVYLRKSSFIPGRLSGRGVTKAISEEEFNRYLEMSGGKVITEENIDAITGNDILISLPYPAMPTFKMTTYKKVVDLKCSMGQGVLDSYVQQTNLGGLLYLVNRQFPLTERFEPDDLLKPNVFGFHSRRL